MNVLTIATLFAISFTHNLVCGDKVCYKVYGCFSDSDPFHRAVVPLPQSPTTIDTRYVLYNRNYRMAGQVIDDMNNETISNSDFDPTKPTVVLTHGYLERMTQFWMRPFIDGLLDAQDVDVIVVGWGNGAKFPYHFACSNARLVGAQINHLLDVFNATKGLDFSTLHLIGFSLGAHAVSYVGRNYRRRGVMVGRITGLDPASPYFEFQHPDVGLDSTDATFVDVIHSNSRLNGIFSMGIEKPIGHRDFYPNGGKFQPGCPDTRPEANLDLANLVACSHYRSILLYIESLNRSESFQAYPCKSWENYKLGMCSTCDSNGCPKMGAPAADIPTTKRLQKFYFETLPVPPYSGEQYKVTFYTGKGFFADLDAGIMIQITGGRATSKYISLEKRYLPHGSTDSFVVTTQHDLGELQDISIKIDTILQLWYVVKIEVAKLPEKETYGACYKTYINSFSRKVKLYKNDLAC